MEWKPWLAPPWSSFFAIAHSVAARSTVLIPLIGYLIIFNDNIVQYLNLSPALGPHAPVGHVSFRLMLVYFGLLFVAAGMGLYAIACPSETKYYASAHAYVGGIQDSINKYSISRIENEVANSDEQFAQQFWRARDASRGATIDAEKFAGRNGILHVYYELKNYSRPNARRCTALLYAAGFLILLIPSADVMLRVFRLLVRATMTWVSA